MTEDIMRLASEYAYYYANVSVRQEQGIELTDYDTRRHDEARAALQAAVERQQSELMEQARLNGMGGEREAALLAKVERLEREAAMQRVSDFGQECEEIDRLREVLRKARWALGRALDTTHSDISYAEISVAIAAIDAELKGEI